MCKGGVEKVLCNFTSEIKQNLHAEAWRFCPRKAGDLTFPDNIGRQSTSEYSPTCLDFHDNPAVLHHLFLFLLDV